MQREGADGWFDRRAERDLVIKIDTGSGETLGGSVLLKSALNGTPGRSAPDPERYARSRLLPSTTAEHVA